uniref:Sulfotransferase n=1 Tax=Physcomitrium patens TaxID=3218 RepID=A0A7I4B4E1_PHYPA
MVDKKTCLPLYFSPLPRSSCMPAANEHFQMAASRKDQNSEVGCDIHVAALQDSCSLKGWRKATVVWKLLVLVVIGGFGLYACMVGVEDRRFSYETVEETTVVKDWRREDNSCSRHGSEGFRRHYPLPHSYERNECTCTPVHYFVILSMQRSGSGWFETLLNNHPNISSHGEVFSVGERRDNFSSIATNMDKVFNLDWLNSASKNECTAAVGFKWMLNQGPMEYNGEVLDYFQKMGVSVILLLRRNVLKRLISIMANTYDQRARILNGTHKSHVHSVEEALKLAEYKPVIDVKHLPERLQRVEQIASDAQRFFNKTRLRPVYYEDLVTDPKQLTEIQEFLRVPPQNLESQQVKIHTRPMREQIQNWDEVLARLNGTKYELLMHDDDYA